MGLSSNGRPSVLDYISVVIASLIGFLIHGLIGAGIAGLILLILFAGVEYLVMIPAEKVEEVEEDILEDPPDKDESG